MNRRNFLQLAVMGAAQAVMSTSVTAAASERARSASSPFRIQPFEWEEATVMQLADAMNSGKETALSLSKKYLARIEEIDQRGPGLKSVLEVNPEALAIARQLDRERKAKGPRGPLHGIPVLIKDNIGTHDRMTTTAGSLALLGSIPAQDSFVARKLREAGAVILGKTNLSEWANFRGNRSSSGWSARGGQTNNPYAIDRNPSGSSSGSAVAVSANFCAIAVGTETIPCFFASASSPATSAVSFKPSSCPLSMCWAKTVLNAFTTCAPGATSAIAAARNRKNPSGCTNTPQAFSACQRTISSMRGPDTSNRCCATS